MRLTYHLSGKIMMALGLLATITAASVSLFPLIAPKAAMDQIIISGIVTTIVGGMIVLFSVDNTIQALTQSSTSAKIAPILATLLALGATLWPLMSAQLTKEQKEIAERLAKQEQVRANFLKQRTSLTKPSRQLLPVQMDMQKIITKLAVISFNSEEMISLFLKTRAALKSGNLKSAEVLLNRIYAMFIDQAKNTTNGKDDAFSNAIAIQLILADLNMGVSDPEKAVKNYEEALKLIPEEETKKRVGLLRKLGTALQESGQHKKAVTTLRDAVAEAKKENSVSNGTNSIDVVAILRQLGKLLSDNGDTDGAVEVLEEALEEANNDTTSDTAEDSSKQIQIDLDFLNENYGDNTVTSPPVELEEVKITTWVEKPFPEPTIKNNTIALVYEAFKKSNYVEAENLLVNLLNHYNTGSLEAAAVKHNLASAVANQKRYAEAIQYMNEAIAIKVDLSDSSDLSLGNSYLNLASIYQKNREYSKAITNQLAGIAIQEKNLGTNHQDLGISYNDMAKLYQRSGDTDSAKSYYAKSLAILKSLPAPNNPYTAIVEENSASIPE
ncbi:MAG: tetratricopeptide repeat protein [Magnetococcales bacterium]|nr:tetratricopeptide repeat protein [Magnetococcales bacterium]